MFSLQLKCSEGNSESSLLFLFNRNGIPSCFLFRGRVRNGIPWFSVPRNSRNSVGNNHLFRLFRLPRNYFFVGNSQPYLENIFCVLSLYDNPIPARYLATIDFLKIPALTVTLKDHQYHSTMHKPGLPKPLHSYCM